MLLWVSEFPIYLFIFLLTEGHRSEPAPGLTLFCGKGPVCRVLSGHKLTFLAVVEQACLLQAKLITTKKSWANSPLGGSKAYTLDRWELVSFKTVVLSVSTECKCNAFIPADDDVIDSKLHGWFADWGRIQSQLQFRVFLYVEHLWIIRLTLESAALLPLFFLPPPPPQKKGKNKNQCHYIVNTSGFLKKKK